MYIYIYVCIYFYINIHILRSVVTVYVYMRQSVVTEDGQLWLWGCGWDGALGLGDLVHHRLPQASSQRLTCFVRVIVCVCRFVCVGVCVCACNCVGIYVICCV